jgi:hypothetical protein
MSETYDNDILDIFNEYADVVDVEYLVNNTRMGY